MLVKIKTAEEKTDGGILLPTTAQTKPQGGEVVAIGEGKTVGKSKVDISVKVYLLLYTFFYLSILHCLFLSLIVFPCTDWHPSCVFQVCWD